MDDKVTCAEFDWDRDQEQLVERPAATPKPPVLSTPDSFKTRARGRLGVFALALAFVLGLVYEKDMLSEARGASAASFAFLDMALPRQDSITVPDGLVIYDQAQAKRFLRDLRLADTQTLQSYIARTGHDLNKAESLLRPFYQDAQLLLTTELARRAASAS